MKSYPVKVTFRQSNNSREFTETEEAELKRNEYIRRGNLLHNIFSQLRDTGDIERVLRQLSLGGILYDEISQEELQRLLKKTMENKQVREWFAPHWTLHNECAIIFKDENNKTVVKRPDRVISDENQTIVIDFKFGKPHSIHKEQVETYIRILRDMGHENVKGYLWYVNENNVVNVD